MYKIDRTRFHKLLPLLFTSVFLPSGLLAKEMALYSDIVDEMERFGEVATATKQNEHYQPYIISVFRGKELERLGIANLEGALSLVPGVDIATDNMNYKTAIFRGSNPFAFGQSKLMIDGILVNDLFLDGYTAYLNMPVEVIKRIEVVRGPGSRTDGVNAYAGSINVVTYVEEVEGFETPDKVFLKGGSYDYRGGGFVKTYRSNDVTLFTEFYYQRDDKRLPVGWDAASTGAYNFPHLGIDNTIRSHFGDAPLWLDQYSLGVTAKYKEVSLKLRRLSHKQGSAYGINNHLPGEDDRTELPSCLVELAYNGIFGDATLEVKAGVKFGSFASQSQLLPDGYQLPSLSDPLGTATTYPDGFYGIHESKQRTLYQSSFLKYRGLKQHALTFGYRLMEEKTYSTTTTTTDRDTGVGLTDYSVSYPFFNANAKRRTLIASVEDKFDYSDALSFMYGVNLENNSLNKTQVDPRVSLVYQADARNIYKVTYSKSHRNPSWQEMYTVNNMARVGNPLLNPERVDAYEAAYIRKFASDSYLQADVFYLSNRAQIDKTNALNEFRNAIDTDIYGFEWEFKGSVSQDDQFYLNYAFVDGKDSNDQSLSNVAKHLLKGYYTYYPMPQLSISGIGKYVGSKGRLSYDERERLDDYMTFDGTIRYESFRDDYSLSLSIHNLFDAEVRYPSEPLTYTGDFPQEGRTFMITFSKAFK